jgi:hypothetical protein
MLRATGCQGGRTGGRAPLLIQEGAERSATGVVMRFRRGTVASRGGGYRTLTPNP